jgi:hypothetical protein
LDVNKLNLGALMLEEYGMKKIAKEEIYKML